MALPKILNVYIVDIQKKNRKKTLVYLFYSCIKSGAVTKPKFSGVNVGMFETLHAKNLDWSIFRSYFSERHICTLCLRG